MSRITRRQFINSSMAAAAGLTAVTGCATEAKKGPAVAVSAVPKRRQIGIPLHDAAQIIA